MFDNYAAFLNCTPVGRASDSDGPDIKLFILFGWGRSFLSVAWPTKKKKKKKTLKNCQNENIRMYFTSLVAILNAKFDQLNSIYQL